MGATRPTKQSLDEIPELDLTRAKVVRRGPKPGRELRMSLRALREAAGQTQAEVATRIESDQAEVSRLEKRNDLLLSTLRRYLMAIGAELEVTAVFKKTGHRVTVEL